jgi:hypothetical protein
MIQSVLPPIETALLLRELAISVSKADYPARNGLFLELHRLHDTIFRLALESHPDASPELAAQAFSIVESMPVPQVIRELGKLNSELVSPEIRKLHKHMNMVRNNMAHKTVLERVVVSRTNAKRMTRLARLMALKLDPEQEAMPDIEESAPPRPTWHRKVLYLGVGLVAGIVLSWAIVASSNVALTMATLIIVVTVIGGLFVLDQQ